MESKLRFGFPESNLAVFLSNDKKNGEEKWENCHFAGDC